MGNRFIVRGVQSPLLIVIALFLVAFIALVSTGITGSSLGQGLQHSGVIEDKTSFLFGTAPRAIRSDEWLVVTPMAIGQVNHEPSFPIENKNLGPDGQNMLVVGMTGVPVAHISAIGRPATWGFFFLELKQALAWYWWLPIFGSLFSVWGLACVGFKLNWLPALGWASLVVFSPYMTAWSYWPAYAVMFPSLALLAVLKIFSANALYSKLTWASLLTLATTGFFLILYPAWQIPLAYLYCSMFVAIYIRDRLWNEGSVEKHILIILALLVSLSIVFLWWTEAKDAILSMTNTVYPGQRSAVRGGDIPNWFLAKGLLSPWTMFTDLPGTNQSESASFYYFIIPSLALFIFATKDPDSELLLPGAILIFMAITLIYQNYGFDQTVAKYTLWGRTTAERTDLVLGVAQVFFIASMMPYFNKRQTGSYSWPTQLFAWSVAIFSAGVVLYWTSRIPIEWRSNQAFLCSQFLGLSIAVIGAYLLVLRSFGKFILLVLSINLLVALAFNPVFFGPKRVVPLGLTNDSGQQPQVKLIDGGRTLVIGSQIPAMMLFASGVEVLNGVHYYPQQSIWQVFDPAGSAKNVYNRYQHLMFLIRELPGNITYEISTPSLDVVYVVLDWKRFDFNALPIKQVLGSTADEPYLKQNQSLAYVARVGSMSLFRVLDEAKSFGMSATVREGN